MRIALPGADPVAAYDQAQDPRPAGDACESGALDGALRAFLDSLDASRVPQTEPSDPQRLCVALSGGRDSVVLLHALTRLVASTPRAITLSALHVNHGISADADRWQEFCMDFCRACGVPLCVVRVEVPRGSGEGLEAAARRVRHAAFARCDAHWLALAHHRDDQAETVLLNLLRGTGLAGAAGMRARRAQGNGPALVRPLLDVPRTLIEDYARARRLAWVEDASNADARFRRNYLRHEVMPRLRAVFPQAERALARASAHFAEGAQLLDELAAIDRAALTNAAGRLSLTGFNALAAEKPARARNLLRFVWLAAGFRAPDTRWIDEALRQLASSDAHSETCVSTVDGALHVYRGEIHVTAHAGVPEAARRWSGESEVAWSDGRLRFIAARDAGIGRSFLAEGDVWLRARQGGERLRPDARRPRRRLRNLLQEAALPPWERGRLPCLWIGGVLAWVGGFGVDAQFACAPGDDGVLPVWEPDAPGAPSP